MNKLRNLIMGVAATLVGGTLAIPASADVSVSGFMNQRIGFGDYRVNSDGDSVKSDDSLHFRTDAEVLFTATGTTDGGLKVTARVELEGDSGGDQIDENWLSVEGNFGKVTLGGEDPAAITHGYVGIGSGFGNIGTYDSGDTWTPVGSDMYPIGYGDYQGIRYSTPSVGGFSGAVSFQPEAADGAGSSQTSGDNDHSLFSVAGSYSTSLGAMSLTIGGGLLTRGDNPDGVTAAQARTDVDNVTEAAATGLAARVVAREALTIDDSLRGSTPVDEYLSNVATTAATEFLDAAADSAGKDDKLGNHWGLGLELGFGSNTIYLRTDVREDEHGEGRDQTDWGIQFERSMGNTTFAVGYAQRTDDGATSAADVEKNKFVAGANYGLGGGTTVGAAVAWGEVDNPGNTPDEDGTSFGAHIAFSF